MLVAGIVPLVPLATLGGCENGGDTGDNSPTTSGPAIQKGSAGGFSASLTADLKAEPGAKPDDKGSAAKPDDQGSAAKPDDKGSAMADSGSAAKSGDKGSDSKVAMADSGSAKADMKSDAGSAAKTDAGSAKSDAKTDAKTDPKADAKTMKSDAGSAAKVDPKADAKVDPKTDAKVDPKTDTKADGKDPKATAAIPTPAAPTHVSTPAELAAIKLNMEPNWDRDTVEPGTISLVVKNSAKPFVFRYGMDDPKAPNDRDAYKKWLGDQKLLLVSLDRQRGAAWYLEGTTGDGTPAFRYLVNYGGKHLICGGLLYKDPESNKLGDIRDRVIIQAKQICESISL